MGTYTETNVQITCNATVTLYGQDQAANQAYTVTDNVGSMNWELLSTITLTAGTYELPFDAASIGPVLTVPGTITVPVTVVLGVTNIINDQAYLSLGTAQETDAQFKIRRQQSTAIGSQGYYDGLVATLQNISGVGVGNVVVYENDTALTSTGTVPANVPANIPSHSIWVVVGGGTASQAAIGGTIGANAPAIATAIYQKRNAGCGMYGSQAYAITRANGTLFPVYWDVVSHIPVFIKFTVGSINGTTYPNLSQIYTQLPGLFTPGINQTLTVNQLISNVYAIDPNTYVSSAGYCLTSGGAFTSTIVPALGDDQFQVISNDFIVTPMIMYSSTSAISISAGIPLTFTVTDSAVNTTGVINFTGYGGYQGGGLTYSIQTNNSGGSINSSGVYTAGTTGSVIDTVKVQDSLGNNATVAVTVT